MRFVVPDDYDQAYLASPHLARLRRYGEVRIYTDPPGDEAALIEHLRPAEVIIPIRERTPFTAERLARLPIGSPGLGWTCSARSRSPRVTGGPSCRTSC